MGKGDVTPCDHLLLLLVISSHNPSWLDIRSTSGLITIHSVHIVSCAFYHMTALVRFKDHAYIQTTCSLGSLLPCML
jgi:acyl-ACP thioesterase